MSSRDSTGSEAVPDLELADASLEEEFDDGFDEDEREMTKRVAPREGNDDPHVPSSPGHGKASTEMTVDRVKVPLRELSNSTFRLNPCVLFFGVVFLWCVCIGFLIEAEGSSIAYTNAKGFISASFGWFYILSQDVWLFVLIAIYIKFGHIKLGQKDEPKEFDDASYFMMIFSAGIGTGLFFYALEPLEHRVQFASNRFDNRPYYSQDQKDQMALDLTLFHWGLLGWVTYSLLAISMALMAYRHGLPLSIRSTIFPLLGRHTWGWIGDFIDGLTVVTIVFGVVTDLVLGAQQITDGLMFLNITPGDNVTTIRLCVIWIIMGVACISVFSGLHRGIKYLSQAAFLLGSLVWASVLFADNTQYLLNVFVQSIGYHFQNLFQLAFTTDAFALLRPTDGNSLDGFSAADETNVDLESSWMNTWTIFYWGWWIAWSPFVGMFLARISRGRTIREVVKFTMIVPFLYIICWFVVFGGAGIRMQRRAEEFEAAGVTKITVAGADCFDVPETMIDLTDNTTVHESVDVNISPVCKMRYFDTSNHWFRLLNQYGELGPILNFLSLVAMVVYFVTSSDSGALVVDTLTANGREDQTVLQRIVWALTQGAVASCIIFAEEQYSLTAYGVQAFTVIAGLPYTIVICLVCSGLWKALSNDDLLVKNGVAWYMDALDDNHHHFNFPIYGGVFDGVELFASLGSPSKAATRGYKTGAWKLVPTFLTSLCLPFVVAMGVQFKAFPRERTQGFVYTLMMTVSFCGAILLCILSASLKDTHFLLNAATVFYFAFALLVARLRHAFRVKYNILHANVLEDFFSSFFLFPQVLAQMVNHMAVAPVPEAKIHSQ